MDTPFQGLSDSQIISGIQGLTTSILEREKNELFTSLSKLKRDEILKLKRGNKKVVEYLKVIINEDEPELLKKIIELGLFPKPALQLYFREEDFYISPDEKENLKIFIFHLLERGKYNLLLSLLELYSLDINIFDENSESFLHRLAWNHSRCIKEEFLTSISSIDGLDFNCKNLDGKTPLHTSIRRNNIEFFKFFIDKFDLEMEDDEGNTPLILASHLGRYEIIDILLNRGVEIETKNKRGEDFESLIEGKNEEYSRFKDWISCPLNGEIVKKYPLYKKIILENKERKLNIKGIPRG